VREIFGGRIDRCDWDGCELQDLGVKTGVLVKVMVTEACGENCGH
jgi:hypothetical protein